MKRLIDGIDLLGKSKDGGYKNSFYLIRTPKKRFIHLTELLYQTVSAMKLERTLEGVAARVSELQNKDVDVNAIRYLIDAKLEPLGIISDPNIIYLSKKAERMQQEPHTPDMLHSLRYRITMLPEGIVRKVAAIYTPLFYTPVMLSVFLSFVLLNIWVFSFHGISAGLRQTVYEPALFLLVFGLILLSSLFHEIGHAAACLFGGGKPGRIGAGIFIIWPAFFTDITDVYRLNKKARLRSDFGGVYFNLVFSLIIGFVYIVTRFEPLLLLILFQNLVVLQQMLPFLRLDGYFVVSDLVGVPDLFTRIGPILGNVFLRKKNNATNDLKLWVKWVVTLWVVVTIPILIMVLGSMLLNAPNVFANAWVSGQMQLNAFSESMQQKEYFVAIVRLMQLVLLMLPVLGICAITYLLGKPLVLKINAKLDSYIDPGPLSKHSFPLNRTNNM